MKLQNYFKIAIFALMSVVLVSCAKSEKDRLVEYNTALVTWLTSPNFMDKMKAEVKTVADISPYMEKNMTKIATEQGFKNTKEANDLFKKFANDADVKKLMQETEKKVTPRLEELMKFQLELMKQEEPNNSGVQPGDTTMMTEQTNAPQPAPEAKK